MKKKLLIIGLMLGLLFVSPNVVKKAIRDLYVPTQVVQLMGVVGGSCSGVHVEINNHTYIVSASHCLPLQTAEGEILVGNDNTEPMFRKVLKEDNESDLIVLEGLPGVRGLSLADNIIDKEEFYTYTHGLGYATYKTEGIYIQETSIDVPMFPITKERTCDLTKPKYIVKKVTMFIFSMDVCTLVENTSVTTAFTAPGSSGGAVTNKYGELVGIVSAGDSFKFSYLVTLKDLQRFLGGL